MDYLKNRLPVVDAQIFVTSAPLKLGYAFSLVDRLSEVKQKALTYPEFTPALPAGYDPR